MDRDEQFHWFIDALGLRKPHIYAYARLNLTNTVMSKRKLTWLVDTGAVDGWDDPRMPTVRGIMRRGLTVEALKEFILAQGSSRSVVYMEWDKIWAFNKKVLDPVVARHTTVDLTYNVPVLIKGQKVSSKTAARHPKNPDVGEKTVWIGPRILIDGADAEQLKENENATFINWGNLMIKKVNEKDGKVESVEADDNTGDNNFKKTLKVTWLCDDDNSPKTPVVLVYYDHIISKAILDKDDDFKNYICKDSKFEIEMIGDPELKSLKRGDKIQVQRRGYFVCDVEYKSYNPAVGRARPCVLICIPDGTVDSYGPPGKKSAAFQPVEKTKKGGGAASPKKQAKVEYKPAAGNANDLNAAVGAQGDLVRKLKADKAPKPDIDVAVKKLLALKADFKAATGQDWKPGAAPTKAASDGAADINNSIVAQGDLARKLKADKAAKADIDEAVKRLLALKAEYKSATGQDWKPGTAPPPAKAASPPKAGSPPAAASGSSAAEINTSIIAQGDLVRKLKADKGAKADIDAAVKQLLSLKADFKAATGIDWKPGTTVPAPAAPAAGVDDLNASIKNQGDKVRKLKADKASKAEIDEAVKQLLSLKADFKAATGSDWTPDAKPKAKSPAKEASPSNAGAGAEISSKIAAQGDLVRQLKSDKKPKEEIEAAVKILLSLKAEFKTATGSDWQPAGGAQSKPEKQKKAAKETKPKEKPKKAPEAGVTRLGLEAKKEDSLPDWYAQVLTKAEMLEYYDVSGCYILRAWSFAIWEAIQRFFDAEIKKLDVQNCYFPIFVSKAALEKEKDHIADFAPEVAWVTKSGDSELAEPIAIRPTSETVMYPAYAKWIQSYRDLPIKLNQWNNVVRWEFKHPQPFLRTREFLWQEGHTAFATFNEANEEVMTILDLYRQIYEDILAIPVICGKKTEKEKFAGGDFTTTTEAYIAAAGRAIQGATSHHLGQNFSKMFDIVFEDPASGEKKHVYQNSWGITTRTIGVLVMVHGDDKGLVLPPKIARYQVVIVPCGITASLSDDDRKALYAACDEYIKNFKEAGIRVHGDYRENYSPGWKFNHWELKGVPIRMELGPRDVKAGQFVAVRRDTGEKITMKKDNCGKEVNDLLTNIQNSLFQRAKSEMDSHLSAVEKWEDFVNALDNSHIIQAPFCGDKDCEDTIKDLSKADVEVEPGAPSMGAKSLCIPFKPLKQLKKDQACVKPGCSNKAKDYTLFGRSY